MALLRAAVISLVFVPSAAAAALEPVRVADVRLAEPAEQILAVSLQGLANTPAQPSPVFLITRPEDWDWLDYCLRSQSRATRTVTVGELLDLMKPETRGQILYDPGAQFTLDVATTAAAIHQAVLSPTDLGLPTLFDFRGRWQSAEEAYQWATDAFLGKCASMKVAMIAGASAALRDFAIQQRIFTVSVPVAPDDAAFQGVLSRLPPGTAFYGDVPYALDVVLSRHSHHIIAATGMANLSFHSLLAAPQPPRQYLGHLEAVAPRYLTLIFDCSDIGFAANELPYLWDDLSRGTLPLGWALPAGLAEVAPLVLHYYYADAYRSGTDQFVLGTNGAGRLELSAAPSPYRFFEATARAQASLDARTALVYSSSASTEVSSGLPQLIAETGVQGVFLTGGPDFEPHTVSGTPVLAAPYFASVQQAVQYLDRVPRERRFVALCLDPYSLGPSDAAHIAAYVGSRYVAVAPEDMIALLRALPELPAPGEPRVAVSSVQYPQSPRPDTPLPISAEVIAQEGVAAVSAVYQPSGSSLAFSQPMRADADCYRAQLPPLLCGGEFKLRVRAVDSSGRIAWSPMLTMQIPRADRDWDGLSDAEESFLLTDVSIPDSDGDGLWDGGDRRALRFDQTVFTYFGPIRPPSDGPYLVRSRKQAGEVPPSGEGESQSSAEGRLISPGQSCTYWLPLGRVPTSAPAEVEIGGAGRAVIAFAAAAVPTKDAGAARGGLALPRGAPPDLPSESAFVEQSAGDLEGWWRSASFSSTTYASGVLVRIGCPPSATDPLRVDSLSVVSASGGPSVAEASVYPPHPGPLQPITVSAVAYSPAGVREVVASYRVNEGGVISFPMQQLPGSQRYLARLPSLENRDLLEWWVTATDTGGNRTATPISWLCIGARPRETVSLVTTRDLAGDWSPAADWMGATRAAFADGLQDSGFANLTGGSYAVWLLGGGRGKSIAVYVRDKRVGSINPDLPDGWQCVGRIRLDAGRHCVSLVSEAGGAETAFAAARYAAVLLSADPVYHPTGDQVVDIYNYLTCLSPLPDDTLSGMAEVRATGAGNLTAVEFSLDGNPLRRVSGPPFSLALSTLRFPNGEHTLRLEGVDRAGPTGLSLEIPITIAN